MISFFLSFFLLLVTTASASADADMPKPFTRELYYSTPELTGNDVIIVQNLLNRDSNVNPKLVTDGTFSPLTSTATIQFQSSVVGLPVTGIIDSVTAQTLLDMYSADGYKDTGFTAGSLGYLYKLYIPVHTDRSIETEGTLFDKDGNVLLKFKAHAHGYRDDCISRPWPDFGDGDIGCNQFTSNGATVTGLMEVDLNSPETNATLYGPYPINRFVRGLDGNAQFLLPYIRDGILLHTGNWTTDANGEWTPQDPMPDSSGCIHSHPNEIEAIYNLLLKQGVVVRDNPFSGKNYPYKPQGK